MLDMFREYRDKLVLEIDIFFRSLRDSFIINDSLFYDSLDRLYDFLCSGKMLRGSMVLFSESMFSGKYSDDAVKCAVSLEILQSGLLIHDDIMDRDTKRRGKDSLFFQYKKMMDKIGLSDSYHVGESMGICLGDFAFSLSFLILGEIQKKEVLDKIILKFGQESAIIGIGQMKDVFMSSKREVPSEDDIILTYKYKTARYSFSLPLSLGAIIAGIGEKDLLLLEEIGEYIGIMFQIQDDKLGLIGDPSVTGKPIGSDIKENKKTIYYLYLMNSVNDSEKAILNEFFGNENITYKEVEFVISLCNKYGVFEKVDKKLEHYSYIAKDKISYLPVSDTYKRYLFDIIEYNLRRNK
ncbi:MAG: polyprenyl synthetase family protein [Brevinematia bacterium]